MKTISGNGVYIDTEHFVLDVGEEPVCINFVRQVDDIIISTPDGPALLKWDNEVWYDMKCLLVNGDVK
jgi:hypothetical protein